MISRDDVVDVLIRDDEALVLTSRQCLRLSALAAAAIAFAEVPRSQDDLRAHLEERFGPPPEGRMEQVLADLVAQRVISATGNAVPSD